MEGCYPKWLYHAEKEPKIVRDQAEHEALGPEWAETPAAFEKKEAPKQEAPKAPESPDALDAKSLEELHALAKEIGLKIHHKTGREKLLQAIGEVLAQGVDA